jgi:hypothetical protein
MIRRILASLLLAIASCGAFAQTATVATLSPMLCTDQAVCAGVPNDQNAYISVSLPTTIDYSLKVSVNGVTKVYPQGAYTMVYNSVPRSFNSYPVVTFPDGRISFYNHSGRSGSYLHSTTCPSCVVWQLTGGTVVY